jgi:GNAT superfamily N-acetyltransferase
MYEYLPYILFVLCTIIFLIHVYIRIKFGFWYLQPVFHIYDISYYFKQPGIINHHLPDKNKYTNFKNIETCNYSKLSQNKLNKFLNFIKTNYLKNKDNIFSPKMENIIPYFVGHNATSYISFYNEDELIHDTKKGNTIMDTKIVGVMTTRPVNIKIYNGDKDAIFIAYYVDYLCVHKFWRKKGIAPQIIQTHEYNQRYLNKNIVVSLFKRENILTGIVPLCVYSTYGFPVYTWTKPPNLDAMHTLLEINSQNFYLLYNFMKLCNSFDIIIIAEVTNIIELIKTKNIFLYVLIVDDEVVSAYFYRKTCVYVEKGLEALCCYATINNTHENVFIQGFKISFWETASKYFFGYAAIENISHNNIIINNLIKKTKPNIITPTAYFFYNFAYKTFKPEKCLIIN